MQLDSQQQQQPLPSASTRPPPPRGILKNSSSSSSSSQPQNQSTHSGLAWDEANLSLNDLQKDSTMKIDEPKTPYVRYNAETDQVMDLDKIPGFELGQTSFNSPPPHHTLNEDSNTSRRGSEGSEKMVRVERTNSFNAQSEQGIKVDGGGNEVEVERPGEVGSDSDDEPADEETKEHRKQFAQKRGRHYSNEAEAMKRAQALMEREDDEDESGGGGEQAIDDEEEEDNYPGNPRENGENGRVPPPVPGIPERFVAGGERNGI